MRHPPSVTITEGNPRQGECMASRSANTSGSSDAPSRAAGKTRSARARKRASIEAQIAEADVLLAKRRAQLESAANRRASLIAKLARLAAREADALGPLAYCLKEKRQVAMIEPTSVQLANGRPAITGTCSSCGSRLMRIGSV